VDCVIPATSRAMEYTIKAREDAMYVCISISIYIYIYIYIYIHICVCVCVYTHTYIYIHTYTYTYMYIYISTHTYILERAYSSAPTARNNTPIVNTRM